MQILHNDCSHIDDGYYLFCNYLIINYYNLGVLKLYIITSTQPLGCLHRVTCNSHNFQIFWKRDRSEKERTNNLGNRRLGFIKSVHEN